MVLKYTLLCTKTHLKSENIPWTYINTNRDYFTLLRCTGYVDNNNKYESNNAANTQRLWLASSRLFNKDLLLARLAHKLICMYYCVTGDVWNCDIDRSTKGLMYTIIPWNVLRLIASSRSVVIVQSKLDVKLRGLGYNMPVSSLINICSQLMSKSVHIYESNIQKLVKFYQRLLI